MSEALDSQDGQDGGDVKMSTYEELRDRKNEIKKKLEAHKDLKGHTSYQMLENEMKGCVDKIKILFRQKQYKV